MVCHIFENPEDNDYCQGWLQALLIIPEVFQRGGQYFISSKVDNDIAQKIIEAYESDEILLSHLDYAYFNL